MMDLENEWQNLLKQNDLLSGSSDNGRTATLLRGVDEIGRESNILAAKAQTGVTQTDNAYDMLSMTRLPSEFFIFCFL